MTQKFEELNFSDPTPAVRDVTIGGARYAVHEADGTASVEYRNAMLDATELGVDGRPCRLHGLASADPVLVSRCLRDEKGAPVPLATILGWRAEIYSRLAAWIKDVSGILSEGSPKNEETSTQDGSD
jgi:hypothetical protein